MKRIQVGWLVVMVVMVVVLVLGGRYFRQTANKLNTFEVDRAVSHHDKDMKVINKDHPRKPQQKCVLFNKEEHVAVDLHE